MMEYKVFDVNAYIFNRKIYSLFIFFRQFLTHYASGDNR